MADTETTTSNNATSVEVVAVGATLAAEAAAAVEPAEAVAETVVATAEEERAVEMVAATAKAEIVEEAGQPEAPPAAVGGVAAEPCPQEEARQSVLAWLNRTTFALSPGTASQAAIAGSALAQKAEAESDEVWLGAYAEPAAGTVGQWATSTSTSAGGADNSSGGEDENEANASYGTLGACYRFEENESGKTVNSIAFDPCGRWIATGSTDGTAKIWATPEAGSDPDNDNAATGGHGGPLRVLAGHRDYVYSVAFSPSGTLVASGSADNDVKLWNAKDGSRMATLSLHDRPVYSVTFSPESSFLASGAFDNKVALWNTSTGRLVTEMDEHDAPVCAVAFSPTCRVLASAGSDDVVMLWSVPDGKRLATLPHGVCVNAVAISSAGILASGGDEGLVKLWDIGTNAEKLFAGGAGGGAEGAVGSTHGAVLEPIASFNTSSESEDVNAVAFSPNGQWLITMTESLQLWNVESAEHSKTLEQESDVCKDMGDGPKCGSFSADGTKLAVACDNGEVKILEMVPR